MDRSTLLAKRSAFQARRHARAALRELLDEETRATRDVLFRDCFMSAIQAPTTAHLQALASLLDGGATTAAFEDQELCAHGNFTTCLDDWLDPYPRRSHIAPMTAPLLEETLACFGLAMEAGDAFVTNRAYVGNGGARATYWLLEWVFSLQPGHEGPKTTAVEQLFEMMLVAAPEDGFFWGDLQASMWRSFQWWTHGTTSDYTPLQRRMMQQVASFLTRPLHTYDETQPWRERFFANQLYRPMRVLSAILSDGGLDWLLPELIEPFEARMGIWQEAELLALPSSAWEPFLDSFLSSVTARRRLVLFWEQSPRFLAALVVHPALIFRLVKQRERRLLQCLLRLAGDELRALRNDKGQHLLHYACECRGRTERIIELLFQRGFSLEAPGEGGESALEIAQRRGDQKVIRMVQALQRRSEGKQEEA